MTRLAGWVLLAGCSSATIAEPPRVVLDPQFVDLGPVYPGQVVERVMTVAEVGTSGSGTVLESIRVDGDGSGYVSAGAVMPLPTPLVAPVPIVVVAQPAEDAVVGLYTVDLVASGTARGEPFERTTRVTLDVVRCDEDGDGFLSTDCNGGDCDDADATVFPGAAELCNGVDDDCNAIVDDTADADGDGYNECEDCDDGDRLVNPGEAERCNGVDDDCDGAIPVDERDVDADGFRTCEGDCDDADRLVNPDAPELCDGKDSDCDGRLPPSEADVDGDGVALCERDCDDNDPDVFPGNVEVCNGMDEDCDEVIDEDGACPCDRVERLGQVYLFCNTDQTWLNALNRCEGWNYSLLTIDDAAEDAFAFSTARSFDSSRKWWIGLNDQAEEGRFEWASGEVLSYTNWNPNEPNDSGAGEDCGQLNRYTDGTWNDEPCTTALPAICELN